MKVFKKLWSYMSFFQACTFHAFMFLVSEGFSQNTDVGNGREVGAESLVL